jgi:hypothetical protein
MTQMEVVDDHVISSTFLDQERETIIHPDVTNPDARGQ